MNIALLLAAGSGTRLESETPKQFIKVGNKTIIEHTLNVFDQHPLIDEIAIVMNERFIDKMETIVKNGGYHKVKKILQGGAERYDSAWAAINAYQEYPDANLLIHDAVRPLIDAKIITEVIRKLENYNAVTVANPTTDTVYQVENNHIQYIPNRKLLMRAQTPQVFKQHIIQKAYQLAFDNKDFTATDDCGVLVQYFPNEPIFVIQGSEKNFKITHPIDVCIFEKMIQKL